MERYLVEGKTTDGGYGTTYYYIANGQKQGERIFKAGSEINLNKKTKAIENIIETNSVEFGFGLRAWEISEAQESEIITEENNTEDRVEKAIVVKSSKKVKKIKKLTLSQGIYPCFPSELLPE